MMTTLFILFLFLCDSHDVEKSATRMFSSKLPLTINKININNEALLSKICRMGITYQEIRVKS